MDSVGGEVVKAVGIVGPYANLPLPEIANDGVVEGEARDAL